LQVDIRSNTDVAAGNIRLILKTFSRCFHRRHRKSSGRASSFGRGLAFLVAALIESILKTFSRKFPT